MSAENNNNEATTATTPRILKTVTPRVIVVYPGGVTPAQGLFSIVQLHDQTPDVQDVFWTATHTFPLRRNPNNLTEEARAFEHELHTRVSNQDDIAGLIVIQDDRRLSPNDILQLASVLDKENNILVEIAPITTQDENDPRVIESIAKRVYRSGVFGRPPVEAQNSMEVSP